MASLDRISPGNPIRQYRGLILNHSNLNPEHCVFVYGTLRSGASGPSHLLQPARLIGSGCFQGRLYDIGDYPGAVESSEPEDQVMGQVYELLRVPVTIRQLDHYEGMGAEDKPPYEYRRKLCSIRMQNGELLSAWVYLYARNVQALKRIQSGDYLSAVSGKRPIRGRMT